MNRQLERGLLIAVLTSFAALATVYSVVVPPFEASDELWHYPMVKAIADTRRLPVQDAANVGAWRQEGSQPPLYYMLGALATAWIDTSDMDEVRHLNVHVDNGVATLDGNINLVVHDPDLETFPWRGTVLAVHIVRLLSVMMGTAAVYLTWRVVQAVAPDRPQLALASAGIHAFTPMYVFISGAVNNDNLVVPLSSLALLQLISLAQQEGQAVTASPGAMDTEPAVPTRSYILLGITLGLAALTKTSSLALTVLTAIVVAARALRRESWSEFLAGGLGTLGPVMLIAGWWYIRNLRLYGDPSGLNVFIEILGRRDVSADASQLWRERFSFAAGYWGNFGGLNVPMPSWTYHALNWLATISAGGLAINFARWFASRIRGKFDGALAPARPGCLMTGPFVLCLLWGIGVIVPWSQWAAVTWSSQGRLIFAALPVWSLLLALGLAAWPPLALGRWAPWAMAGFLLILAVAAPGAWIAPAYALPQPLGEEELGEITSATDVHFSLESSDDRSVQPAMKLLGYLLETEQTSPGGSLPITLYWEAISPTVSDCTVFVHLLGEGELLVAQRDTFPAVGLLSTTRLEPGNRWADRYVLRIPETAFAPDAAQIEVGMYETATGTRLQAAGPSGMEVGDHVEFGHVTVASEATQGPNPVNIHFGDGMVLVGYDLDRRIAAPGEVVTLTLYWEARRPMRIDYTVSAQLVDGQQRKAAQLDGWPRAGDAPTSGWAEGQTIVDVVPLAVYEDSVPGVYDVRLAVYSFVEGRILHLPIVPQDGRMLADHIVLTKARVLPH